MMTCPKKNGGLSSLSCFCLQNDREATEQKSDTPDSAEQVGLLSKTVQNHSTCRVHKHLLPCTCMSVSHNVVRPMSHVTYVTLRLSCGRMTVLQPCGSYEQCCVPTCVQADGEGEKAAMLRLDKLTMHAARSDQDPSLDIMLRLMKAGADVRAKTRTGKTAEQLARQQVERADQYWGRRRPVSRLKADILSYAMGELQQAAAAGNLALMKAIARDNRLFSSVNQKNAQGRAALHEVS